MLDDTIAAIATPIGTGGIGIIKISGTESIKILNKIFKCRTNNFLSHKIYYGHIFDPENKIIIDEVLVSIMLAPKSYTCEDVIEINCHGGIICVKQVLDLVLKNGARLAEPGEFTKRAYINGRIDLSQAEAVIDLINSKTSLAKKISLEQLDGQLSKKISLYEKKILDILSRLEVSIDYPDEYKILDLEIKNNIIDILGELKDLIKSANTGKIIHDGINIAIIGKPNVGKSSLLNSLSQKDSAIVTDIPGTTRDIIHEYINIDGIAAKILDTAGIHESDNQIENLGIQKAIKCADNADVILLVFDWSREFSLDDKNLLDNIYNKHKQKILFVANKIDLEQKNFFDYNKYSDVLNKNVIKISAQKNLGINSLIKKIKALVLDNDIINNSDQIVICNIRHEIALKNSYESLLKALDTIENNMPSDLISIDLRDAYDFLGEITGNSVSDDVIQEIFSKFCVGK